MVLGRQNGQATALNTLTWEKRLLPGGSGDWQVLTDDGEASLRRQSTGETISANECFEQAVVYDPDDELLFVHDTSGRLRPWNDAICQFDPMDVKLQTLGHCVTTLCAWRFRRLNAGCCVWWSLSDIYSSADTPHSVQPSRWYHSWWPWWTKTSRLMEVDFPRLRRAAPTSQSKPESMELVEKHGRVLPGYSMSTVGLMIILPRWCGTGLRAKQDKAACASRKWRAFFELLVNSYLLGGEWEITFCLDQQVQCFPNFSCLGRRGGRACCSTTWPGASTTTGPCCPSLGVATPGASAIARSC